MKEWLATKSSGRIQWQIAKNVDEDYAAAFQELLQKRFDFKIKIEALLKLRDKAGILRSLEDAEQRRAEARAISAADEASANGTSPQKELQQDDEQKKLEDHNADDRQDPTNGARSQPTEELSIHSQFDKTKSNKTAVFSKTSRVRRILDLELKALREQKNCKSA